MGGHIHLRRLPSVGRVLDALEDSGLLSAFPRRAATQSVRDALEEVRRRLREAQVLPPAWAPGDAAALERAVADRAGALLQRRFGRTLRRAINATGVMLHTNLGRAPLSAAAQAAVADAASGYSTLELDLETGERGSRHAHIETLLTSVTGAEAGFAVNNAASAVTLALAALSGGGAVAISRGELVEIGGSFRMPEVMRQGGARLLEVGTTNRTYLADFEAALADGAALLLKVHRSNFTQSGFVHDVPLEALVTLGRQRGVSVVYDLGSGCLVDLRAIGLPQEPMVQAAVASGADLVLCSGDKLMGGPQAGVIVGQRTAVDRCRRHPLARAVRLDKLTLAALAETLRAYLDPPRAWQEIPILAMLAEPEAARRRRALRLGRSLDRALGAAADVDVIATTGEVGGGSLPGTALPSYAVAVRPRAGRAETWAGRLRTAPTPVFGLVRDGALILDVLALLPGEDRLLPGLLRPLADG